MNNVEQFIKNIRSPGHYLFTILTEANLLCLFGYTILFWREYIFIHSWKAAGMYCLILFWFMLLAFFIHDCVGLGFAGIKYDPEKNKEH
jgi:hypothetical protein